jgi:tetratricopeptide (TPR) repeat protein
LQAYDKTLELNPDDAKAWYNEGVALHKLGRHEETLQAYDKALELNPDDANAWYNKGVELHKLGRSTEHDFGMAYAKSMLEQKIEGTVDIEEMMRIPYGPHGLLPDHYAAMHQAGIESPDARMFWQGYNDYMLLRQKDD